MMIGFVLVLAACGKQNSNNGSSKDKVLNVGTEATFAPFEYQQKGKIVGFDVDLLNAVAKQAGYKISIKNTGWDAMLAGLQNKELDVGMAGITINDERKKSYDFSNPYFESKSMIVFKKGTNIKTAKDLIGKKVGVQNGTTGQFTAESILGKNSNKISKYETSALCFTALKSGDVDAVVTDNAVALQYVKNNPNSNLETVTDKSFKSEYYGIAFPKNSDLKAKFDKALTKVMDNGEYAKIYKKWFNKQPDVDVLKNAAK